MFEVALYDCKPYDVEFFKSTPGQEKMSWRYFDFRLSSDTAKTAEGARAVCVFVNDKLNSECLDALSQFGVQHIALRCAGYNNVDLAVARALKLPVTRVPAYSPNAVAEHTVGLLLAACRKIHRAYDRVRDLNFSLSGLVGVDIHGKTVGVVGCGKIGKIVAQIMTGFEANVLCYDPHPDEEWAVQWGVKYVDFRDMLPVCDMYTLHVPLIPETFHLLSAEVLFRMKRGAIIVNTSRGAVIDTEALIMALKTGHLGGVALDTYEEEEGIFFQDLSGQILLDDDLLRLLMFPNVLITAHQGFLSANALAEISRITIDNLLRGERGEPFLPGTLLTSS